MKTTDLMVGDWVAITEPDDYHGYIGKVKIINDETGYITVFIKDGHLHDVLIDDLQPIPITPEILDKIGRNSRGRYPDSIIWDIPCGGLDVIYVTYFDEYQPTRTIDKHIALIQIGEVGRSNMWLCKYINYVHQLQHSLKNEIDKEIVL